MIYRIDLKHFLTHMIDYFTLEDIYHFQYAIISAGVPNQGRLTASTGTGCVVAKIPNLYPTPEIVTAYAEHQDKKMLEKMYFDYLDTSNEGNDWIGMLILKTFVNPLMNHFDIMIVCTPEENDYIDVLCKFLHKKFYIDVIDLNKLFTEGRVGPIYIDRSQIKDNAVRLNREAVRLEREDMSTSRDGRMRLVMNVMSKKDKIKKLHELGISTKNENEERLNRLLIDAWVDEDED